MVFLLIAAFALMMYFAGTETAVCSLAPSQRESILSRAGARGAKALSLFLKKPHRVLTSILIGNALSVVTASVAVQALAMDFARRSGVREGVAGTAASFILFCFVVFFGEIIPKTAARKNPEKFAALSLPALRGFIFLLMPAAISLFAVNRRLLALFGLKLSKTLPRTSLQEFTALAESAFMAGKISPEERRMIKGLLDFPGKEVRQVMIPEVEIAAVDINWGRDKILEKIARYNHSRIPVYSDSLDNIVGLIYTKDILSVINYGGLIILKDIIRPPSFVPETAPVETLLKKFMQGREHLSVAVDEYGKVTGIITLEDVLEEITGDIFDEFDREVLYKRAADGSWLVPAREDIDRVNDKLSLSLPTEETESLGGLILEKLNYLPKPGEKVAYGNVELEVASADRQKIKTVRVRKAPAPVEASGE